MSGNEWLCGLVAVLVIATVTTMFPNSIRGSMVTASAKMKYLYERTASSVLGGPDLGTLTLYEEAFLPDEKNRYVGGLYNEGNTCFMNSVVQSLSSCSKFRVYLEKLISIRNAAMKQEEQEKEQESGDLIPTLEELCRALNTKLGSTHNYSTEKLTQSIAKLTNWKYDMYNQEDAQEFFQQILLGMEKELQQKELPFEKNKPNTPFDGTLAVRVGCVKCGETEGIREGVVSSIDVNLSERDCSSIQLEELLDEYVAMETIPEVECYRCSLIGYKADLEKKIRLYSENSSESRSEKSGDNMSENRSESYSSESNSSGSQSPIATPISSPEGQNQDQTQGQNASHDKNSMLLGLYQTRVDQITRALEAKVIDDKQYALLKPKSLKQLGDKTKQVMFSEPLADVLMIHINRSVFDMRTGYSVKNYTPVVFPMKLDMKPYTVGDHKLNEDPSKPMLPNKLVDEDSGIYELKASVLHYGSHNFGHYLCFRKCDKGLWWRISDDSVSLSTEAQVLKCQGIFMLFYQRMTPEQLEHEAELEKQLILAKELKKHHHQDGLHIAVGDDDTDEYGVPHKRQREDTDGVEMDSLNSSSANDDASVGSGALSDDGASTSDEMSE